MKAIVQETYGAPEVLHAAEVPRPEPGPHEVLVAVRAAAVNAADWHIMRGDPLVARLLSPAYFGRTGPKARIRGRDFAGEVVAVGAEVTRFRVGDEVFGDLGGADGAFAEYVCAPAALMERKPMDLSFAQAAAIPLAGTTALAGLRDAARVRPGQRVLINGASGGVGTFAVQLAKHFGAEVTGVCRTRNLDQTRSLGADHVIDYTERDFTREPERYDVLFDLVGNHSLTALRRALTPAGTVALSGGGVSKGGSVIGPMGLMLKAQVLGRFVEQRVVILSTRPCSEHLAELRELAGSGALVPVIDRTYPLDEVPEAIHYL